MNDSSASNPYRPPSVETAGDIQPLPESESLFSISATSNKRHFTVLGFEDRLQLQEDNGGLFEVLRSDPLFVRLMDGVRAFRVKATNGTFTLTFPPEDFETPTAWIGLPTVLDLREALAVKIWWQIPVAILFFLAGPAQLLSFVKGIILLVHWIGCRFEPHRWLFIPYGLFFLLIFCENATQTYWTLQAGETPSVLVIVFGLISLLVARNSYKSFLRYRQLQPVDSTGHNTSAHW